MLPIPISSSFFLESNLETSVDCVVVNSFGKNPKFMQVLAERPLVDATPCSPKPSSVFGFSAILDGLLVAVPPSRVRHSRGCSLYAARLIDVPPEICEQLQCDPATCDRLHVEPEYVRQLRQQSSTACCAYCGDVFSRMILADVPALQLLASFIVDGVTFPIERLSLTCAIPILGFKPERTLRAEILCRHHLNGICSSGKDCPYFHICRHRPRNS